MLAIHNAIHSAEITGEVRISDILSIHTRNSTYEFFIIDPIRAYGLIRGGAFGDKVTEAFLCVPTTLVPGSKVRMLIESAKGPRYVTTSAIETIKCLRCE